MRTVHQEADLAILENQKTRKPQNREKSEYIGQIFYKVIPKYFLRLFFANFNIPGTTEIL